MRALYCLCALVFTTALSLLLYVSTRTQTLIVDPEEIEIDHEAFDHFYEREPLRAPINDLVDDDHDGYVQILQVLAVLVLSGGIIRTYIGYVLYSLRFGSIGTRGTNTIRPAVNSKKKHQEICQAIEDINNSNTSMPVAEK
eukprot:320432_1